MSQRIDPRTRIGHVHLKVADLERAIAFYHGVLGFEITQRMGPSAAFLGAGGYHHHIGLNTWESRGGTAPPRGSTGLYHVAIAYPDRAALGDALRRLREGGIPLEGASDHGVSEALYLRDPDGNGLELYWDRPENEWPRAADGSLQMVTDPLDVESLLSAAAASPDTRASDSGTSVPMAPVTRDRLRHLRLAVLNLHKALLDDAKSAYELDRGRIASNATLLQLVINDPWFAWLRSISELIVRIDEAIEQASPATDADASSLIDQMDRLLTASETGQPFQRRYFEALQRQPAVVLAHGEVRKLLKQART